MRKSLLFLLILLTSCSKSQDGTVGRIISWAYQLQDAEPSQIEDSGFDLVVIDYSRDGTDSTIYSYEEILRLVEEGITPIAYLSIGEAENYRFYWEREWDTNPPEWLGEENPNWPGNFAVKYWSDEWENILIDYLNRIIGEGFKGVYLDKVDEFEYWAERGVLEEDEAANYMIDLIINIASYLRQQTSPSFLIIPQNGERLILFDDGRLTATVSGWAVEDLLYNGLMRVDDSVWIERINILRSQIMNGKILLSVDYVDDGSGFSGENRLRILDYIERARKLGFIPYAARSDRALDELNIIEGIQP